MSETSDYGVELTEQERGQLRSAALMMSGMVRKDDPEVANKLAQPYDLTDEALISNLATGWSYVQPRLQASFDVIRATFQQVYDTYRLVLDQFMENVDIEALQAAIEEGDDDGR